MSIGSLYEYYANKEAILIEILDDYFEDFLDHQDSFTELFTKQIHEFDKRLWLRAIIDQLIVTDPEAAAVVFMDMLDSLIDRIILYPLPIDRERIVEQGINAICLFLFGKMNFE